MTTITTPLRRSPGTVRTPSAPSSAWMRRAVRSLRHRAEGMNADDRASLCELTLRSYDEARTLR